MDFKGLAVRLLSPRRPRVQKYVTRLAITIQCSMVNRQYLLPSVVPSTTYKLPYHLGRTSLVEIVNHSTIHSLDREMEVTDFITWESQIAD